MGFWPIKNAKTRYGWSFILLEMLKKVRLRHDWSPLLFKKQKYGTPEVQSI